MYRMNECVFKTNLITTKKNKFIYMQLICLLALANLFIMFIMLTRQRINKKKERNFYVIC